MDIERNCLTRKSAKKILISSITLEEGNIIPLLLKIKYWQTKKCKITIFGNKLLKNRIDNLKIINGYEFIELKHSKKIRNKIQFIFEGIKRNFLALFYINNIRSRYDVIYTISPVLDSIIFPYLLKKVDKKIKWVTVFDNTVPLFSDGKMIAGNKFIRILAWIFFKISLFLLKKADSIFVIKVELKQCFLERGFDNNKLILTGNGVEKELISNARGKKIFESDAIYVGRINEAKGIYDLLKVLTVIVKIIPGFKLSIMGNGDDETVFNFKKKIEKLNLKDNVVFWGYRSGQEKFDIIKSAKSFWFFSYTESFGISLLEAVCCGLTAFAYDLEIYRKIYINDEVNFYKKGVIIKKNKKSIENKTLESSLCQEKYFDDLILPLSDQIMELKRFYKK